jgi:hypothetical protein
MIECKDCYAVYGTQCISETGCWTFGGCNYVLPTDTVRDDIMTMGFIPGHYVSPLHIKITRISGTDFSEQNNCPKDNNVSGQSTDQWVRASSFKSSLFTTLTEMDLLGAPADSCSRDTHSRCTNGACSNSQEECVNNWCRCQTGYCFYEKHFECRKQGTAGAMEQAVISWVPIVLMTVSVDLLQQMFG